MCDGESVRIILICGPSGAGKDTMIKQAKEYFKGHLRINFVKRYITRPPDKSEDNFYVCRKGFDILREKDFFISWWECYGNLYGIPKYMIKRDCCNFISVSRSVVPYFEKKFKDVYVIYVTADFEIIKERIRERNREDIEVLNQRLKRYHLDVPSKNKITFKTHGPFEEIRRNFINLCKDLVHDFLKRS